MTATLEEVDKFIKKAREAEKQVKTIYSESLGKVSHMLNEITEVKVQAKLYQQRAAIYFALGDYNNTINDCIMCNKYQTEASQEPEPYLLHAKALHSKAKYAEAMELCRNAYAIANSNAKYAEAKKESSQLLKDLMALTSQNNRIVPYTRKTGCPTFNFSVVVVQHADGRFLAVKETRNRGWWLPAGFVDPGETFIQAAHRETMEEAGIKVRLDGILRVEHSIQGACSARMRVIFFARPEDSTPPKSVADEESERAEWMDLTQLEEMSAAGVLRGDELLQWGNYLHNGGAIFPLYVLAEESALTHSPSAPTILYGTLHDKNDHNSTNATTENKMPTTLPSKST